MKLLLACACVHLPPTTVGLIQLDCGKSVQAAHAFKEMKPKAY